MPITLTAIADQTTAINTATAALAFTVARTPIVVEVAALAYFDTLDEIDLGTDAAALGIEVGSGISGYGIPGGAVVNSISGNSVFSDLSFTADGDGSDVTFAPPISGVTVTALSYDTTRIASVVLGGSGASRTVTVTPATLKSGRSTIQITATAGDDETVETFLLTITPATSGYSIPASWISQVVGIEQEISSQGESATLEFAAPYPACITLGDAAYRPGYGVRIAGLAINMVVGSVKVKPITTDDSGYAFVTIGLIPPEKSEETDSEGEPVLVSYLCHWETEQKPLHTANIYMPKGSKALSEGDLIDIEYWKEESDGARRKLFKYKREGYLPVTLSINAQHYAKKVLRGTESYPVSYPVVSKNGVTRTSLAFATTMNKYFKAPPGFPKDKYPAGWIWVGVEDDRQQQGRAGPKERSESYRGVNLVDQDVYVAGV